MYYSTTVTRIIVYNNNNGQARPIGNVTVENAKWPKVENTKWPTVDNTKWPTVENTKWPTVDNTKWPTVDNTNDDRPSPWSFYTVQSKSTKKE